RSHAEKGRLFWELHKRREILILPNPWDAGTAKLLASLGFEALATTSLGMSNALGRIDGEGSVSRAELLENCRVIAHATDLPSMPTWKTATPMIPRKPPRSCVTPPKWALLGARSRIGAASASTNSTTLSSAWRRAPRWRA